MLDTDYRSIATIQMVYDWAIHQALDFKVNPKAKSRHSNYFKRYQSWSSLQSTFTCLLYLGEQLAAALRSVMAESTASFGPDIVSAVEGSRPLSRRYPGSSFNIAFLVHVRGTDVGYSERNVLLVERHEG